MYHMMKTTNDAPTEPIWQSRSSTAVIPPVRAKQLPRHANPPKGGPGLMTVISSLGLAAALAIPTGVVIGTAATSSDGPTAPTTSSAPAKQLPVIQAALQAPGAELGDEPAADPTPDPEPTATPDPTETTTAPEPTTTEPEPTTTVPTGPVISSDGNGHYWASPPPAVIPRPSRPGQTTFAYVPPPQPKETPTPTPTETTPEPEPTSTPETPADETINSEN